MCDGEDRFADLYLILSDPGSAGHRALRLAEIIRSARRHRADRMSEEAGGGYSRQEVFRAL